MWCYVNKSIKISVYFIVQFTIISNRDEEKQGIFIQLEGHFINLKRVKCPESNLTGVAHQQFIWIALLN